MTLLLRLIFLCAMISPFSTALCLAQSKPSEFDIVVASQVALPCIDCTWQGRWCRICLGLPLTIASAQSGSVPDNSLARLDASPWLRSASACMAQAGRLPVDNSVPKRLEDIALTRDPAAVRLRHVESCLVAEMKDASYSQPRWELEWSADTSTLKITNNRKDNETALVIVALHDVATDRSIEIPLDSAQSVVKVPAGGVARVPLHVVKRFGKGTTVEVAVTSASRITRDRSELSVLSIELGG